MKHRGVSEVTGSVIMLGVVGSIAALILTLGLSSITDFQTFLIDVDNTEDTLKENFIIEYVNFAEGTETVTLYVRNIGRNTVTIESFSIINVDTQELILLKNTGINEVIQPRTREDIQFTDASCTFTADSDCATANYLITLVTTRSNIYETEAVPFST